MRAYVQTRGALVSVLTTWLLASGVACVRPADERYSLEKDVGKAELPGLQVDILDGQAAIRELDADTMLLWGQAPVMQVSIESDRDRPFFIELRNCMPDARVELGGQVYESLAKERPTWCRFEVFLDGGANELLIAPPDWDDETNYRFASMGDIQTAMPDVDEVFDAISAVPNLRFVMSTGDVVERGADEEYELFEEQLEHLNIPFFSTIGNHELTEDIERWHERYGRFSVHFRFKGVDFSYVDSGNASLDPKVYRDLEDWIAEGRDRIHIFGTHYPPFDPVGIRNGGFRSRNEAYKLLSILRRGDVDLTLYGHIHSYYEFDNADIPAFISGGGGALPEKLDGIDRHFLVLHVDQRASEVVDVEVVRVD